MNKVRTVFEKKGRAKYISHLDLNRFILRAFRRSRLPIWYTEGYNPHPYVAFALALSLGFESSCEVMDFNLNEEMDYEEIIKRLNAVMPEGIRFISADAPKKKSADIALAEYNVFMGCENPSEAFVKFDEFFSSEQIIVEKKTKKGMTEIDIKPLVQIIEKTCNDDGIRIIMRLPAGNQTNYNPNLLIDAFKTSANVNPDTLKICRTAIFCANEEKFS